MNILFCSGEAYPFSKSGGLADVAAALPKALTKLGHKVSIITPFYEVIKEKHFQTQKMGEAIIKMGDYEKLAIYHMTYHDGIPYIFIENDDFFGRKKYYGYEDDASRFTFFNFAIFEYIKLSKNYPDILHANDWQTALIPFFLDVKYRMQDSKFKHMKTLLSIHNLEKQGSYPIETEKLFGHKNFTYIHLDRVNFLKCGIMRANAINTVSENYRNEILTRFYGFTLDGPLRARQHDLYGILNGLDQELYDPKTNQNLFQTYDIETFREGKSHNKKALLKTLKLSQDDRIPMMSFIHRFARQKGIDLLMPVLSLFLKAKKISLVVIGHGDALYEQYFTKLAHEFPDLVYYEPSFDPVLSQKAYAASDIFLLPSLFEPCGLNHMIAMRYGALPLVRETGGLKDSVTPYNKFTNIGVGFAFKNYDADELKETIETALEIYHDDKDAWNELIHQAMHVNHSLSKMAKQYEQLYDHILKNA